MISPSAEQIRERLAAVKAAARDNEVDLFNRDHHARWDDVEWLLEQLAEAQAEREAAFKAGYHCRWHKGFRTYTFDPAMSPGDPDGAYKAWRETQG